MSSGVPAVSDEELLMFKFTRTEVERLMYGALDRVDKMTRWGATSIAVEYQALAVRLRDALEGR